MPAAYLGTRDIPVADLNRFPGNARRGDVDEIRRSIRRHAQYRSLAVRQHDDGTLTILAGNHTYDAISAEGHETARCELITCTDDDAVRINLLDNRIPELGGYDEQALAEQLMLLDGDYEGTGFTAAYLDNLFGAGDEKPPPDEFPSYDGDTIETEHECPSCGYRWSGKTAGTGPGGGDG